MITEPALELAAAIAEISNIDCNGEGNGAVTITVSGVLSLMTFLGITDW